MACYVFDGSLEMAIELIRLAPVKTRLKLNPEPTLEQSNSYGLVEFKAGDGIVDHRNGEFRRVPKDELAKDWEKVSP